MAHLSQREAARLWSIPWTTFRRAVKSGKVSIGGDGEVDPAEMVRAFGEPVAPPNGPNGTTHGPAAVELENARLRAEVEGLRALVAAKDETIAAMRLLTHSSTAPQKRRWWQFGH